MTATAARYQLTAVDAEILADAFNMSTAYRSTDANHPYAFGLCSGLTVPVVYIARKAALAAGRELDARAELMIDEAQTLRACGTTAEVRQWMTAHHKAPVLLPAAADDIVWAAGHGVAASVLVGLVYLVRELTCS